MTGQITISNKSKKITLIDIEGIIGVPEEWQFEENSSLIATYQKFRDVIAKIGEISSKEIIVNIRSTGGNVNDALLIFDTLSALECQITTRCYGYVASAATIIAQAASQGKREISQNALYLVHKSSSTSEGNAEQLSQTIELLEKTDQRISAIYANRSGKNTEIFQKLMSENNGNGKWLAPMEVLEIGFADKIIAPTKISNNAKEIIEALNLPEIPNQNENMTIKHHLNAIFDVLGLNSKSEKTETSSIAKKCYTELEQEIENYQTPKENILVTELQNKIIELEAMNAKLKAKATQTFPKEDPSMRELKFESNADAYQKDINNFKNY